MTINTNNDAAGPWESVVVSSRPSLAYVAAALLVSFAWYAALMWLPVTRVGLHLWEALPEPWHPVAAAIVVLAVGMSAALMLRRRLVRGHWGHVIQFGVQAPLLGTIVICFVQGVITAVHRAHSGIVDVIVLTILYPLSGAIFGALGGWFLFLPLGWLSVWILQRVARTHDSVPQHVAQLGTS